MGALELQLHLFGLVCSFPCCIHVRTKQHPRSQRIQVVEIGVQLQKSRK